MKHEIFEKLRLLPVFLHNPNPRESHPFSLLPGGFPKGSVVEISSPNGCGKTELILRFLIENPSLKVAWIEEDFTIYPSTCSQAGLGRILFIHSTPQGALKIAHQVLRSQVFALVVLGETLCGELQLRKLQLASQKSGATVILLNSSSTTEHCWPLSLQLTISRLANELKLTLLRSRRP